jgi:hypothetical protein
VEGKYTGTRYVHAGAEVEAKVWYSKKRKNLFNTRNKSANRSYGTKVCNKF